MLRFKIWHITAKDLIESSNKNNPVVSDLIESLLANNKYYKNNTSTAPFEEMVTDILIFGEEAKMAVISKTSDGLSVSGIGLFNGYNLQGILSANESITYNILSGNTTNATYSIPCDQEYLTLGIYKSDPKIEVSNNKINITVDAKASVIESNCNYNFKDTETYEELNEKAAKVIKKDIYNFIDTTLKLDSDILGIRRTYYIKNRVKNNDVWKMLDYKVDVNLKTNKKGLIFEVENDY